jgi:hypothetical protein
MNRTEFEKRLRVQAIDAHRELLRIEIEALGGQLGSALSPLAWGRRWVPLSAAIDAFVRTLDLEKDGRWGKWLRFAPLIPLALPLLGLFGRRRRENR